MAAEAFEVAPGRVAELPGGKEADGIIGDFVLRNNLVEAVISQNAPLRRANMSTFYGDDGVTPGCLYDLTLRGAQNDQLTIFSPLNQRGPVSWVRVAADGSEGRAEVEAAATGALRDGLAVRHTYALEDGWQGILVISILRNESDAEKTIEANDRWTSFARTGRFRSVRWADAVDPADRVGYAFGWLEGEGWTVPGEELTILPGAEVAMARFVAAGRSPAEATGLVLERRGSATGILEVQLTGPEDEGVGSAEIQVVDGDETLSAYPDDEGRSTFLAGEGPVQLRIQDRGRPVVEATPTAAAGLVVSVPVTLGPASGLRFRIRDEAGHAIPCKAQFAGIDGTPNPNLGPPNRAHGCVDQYHSETGDFEVALDPGRYRVRVTRGIEYDHISKELEIPAGTFVDLDGVLNRVVDTTGWVSTDFHNHSTPSGDNTCGTDDRVINLAAEHIEFAPTTEHNRLYDWTPHIIRLGLSPYLSTAPGIELTGSGAHLNSFPFKPELGTQDNGAPVWKKDPRLNAITLRDFQGGDPDRWVQINHPDLVANFIDRDGDGKVDQGFAGLGSMIDAVETQNFLGHEILAGAPFKLGPAPGGVGRRVLMIREFLWLQLLNQGHRIWGTAVADAHSVYGNGAGGWRVYIPSWTDDPAAVDWREIVRNAKSGRMMLTTGPFLEVRTDDGAIAGGLVQGRSEVELHIRVQCADWVEIDRVQILVNGRAREDLNFTRTSHPDWFTGETIRFERRVPLSLSADSHLIVVAIGENSTLETGYGTSDQGRMAPCAYHNPIFVDVDGGGFRANGDTLDYPLPTAGMSVEDVERLLTR